MKHYDILWTQTAENDLKSVITYSTVHDSKESALRIFKTIKENCNKLGYSPEKCRLVPELKKQGVDLYRGRIIPPWRIIFKIYDTTVIILSVLDSRRNLEDLLLNRFQA